MPGSRNAINALSRVSIKPEETPWISMHWVDLHERHSPLFTIEDRFPKLDVAGSIPVSRSIFSITWEVFMFSGLVRLVR
jgi:hypothetical protein